MNTNWKHRFFTIWAGQAISLISSAVLQMAIIWHLTNTTGSAMVLSLATMVGFLPQAIFGTMIGVLVDRWNRKLVMIGADIIIAIAGLSLALLDFITELPVWAVLLVLFIRSVGTTFHSPAISAVTPLLVPEDQLAKCAGYSQSIQSVSYILSPAIASFLYANWGLNSTITLDVFGATVACITVAIVAIPNQRTTATQQSSFFIELKDGYQAVKQDKALFSLLWLGALYSFAYMPINALFPLMSLNYFSGTTVHASIVEMLFAGGMLVGGLVLGTWGGFKNPAVNIIGSLALMGIALTVSGLLSPASFVTFVLCCSLMGFSAPFYSGVQISLFQKRIAPELLGRVFGLIGSIMSLAMPLGLIASGIFADQIGVNNWFTLSGICILVIAGLGGSLPSIRKLGE